MLSLHVGNMHAMVVDFDARWSGFRPVFFDRIKATIFAVQATMLGHKFSALLLRKARLPLALEVRDDTWVALDPALLFLGGRKFIKLCLNRSCTLARSWCRPRLGDYPEPSCL